MSYGVRLALLKACLVRIPIYLLSMIKFPKWAIEAINSHMANFFLDDSDKKHKYHLSNWGSLTQRKEEGGLGIPDLRDLNLWLLASWVNRYQSDPPSVWKEIIDHKYLTAAPNILCCEDRQSSPFWKGVLWAAQAARIGYA
jgi:hypothetical protein